MSTPAGVAVPQRPVRRLDRKLSNIAAGRYTPDDFVIADAKDADMAFGVTSAGPVTDTPAGEAGPGRYRTRSEYLGAMRALAAQGELDVLLTSASNGERLAQDGSLEDRHWPSGRTTARTSGITGVAAIPLCPHAHSAPPT